MPISSSMLFVMPPARTSLVSSRQHMQLRCARSAGRLLAVGTLSLLCVSVAHAQQRGEGAPIEPRSTPATMPDASGLLATTLPPDFEVPVLTMPPEGSLLPPTTGDLVALPTGDIAFRPLLQTSSDGVSAVPSLPVFALLPSPRLIQIRSVMEQARAANRQKGIRESTRNVEEMPRVRGVLSGQVWLYRGRAFLSPASFAPAVESETPSDAQTSNQAPKQEQQGAAPTGSVPASGPTSPTPPSTSDLNKLFEDIESMPTAPRVLSNAGADTRRREETTTAASAPLLSDGTVLVGLTGRFVRMSELGGRLGLAFDNDASSPPTGEANDATARETAAKQNSPTKNLSTMPLLPCQTLERMEALAAQHADSMSFVVTGRVVSDGDRNFFMPLFFQARMPTSVSPGQ